VILAVQVQELFRVVAGKTIRFTSYLEDRDMAIQEVLKHAILYTVEVKSRLSLFGLVKKAMLGVPSTVLRMMSMTDCAGFASSDHYRTHHGVQKAVSDSARPIDTIIFLVDKPNSIQQVSNMELRKDV
jgi:hypothetical protein